MNNVVCKGAGPEKSFFRLVHITIKTSLAVAPSPTQSPCVLSPYVYMCTLSLVTVISECVMLLLCFRR